MIFTSNQPKTNLNIPVVGDTIKINRKVALKLKESMGIQFHPIVMDVTRVNGVQADNVTLKGKLTKSNGSICRCCGKTLKTDMSKITGLGPVCSKYLGVQHPKSSEEVESYKEMVEKKVEEIGEFEFTIKTNQIRKWDGIGSMFLKLK